MPRSLRTLFTLLLPALLGCTSRVAAPPPERAPATPPTPPTPAASVAPDREEGFRVSGTLGQLDEAAVEEQLHGRLGEMNRCYQEVLKQKWFLSGRLEMKLRITADGQVRQAAVVSSSLGSYEVERCVQRVVLAVRFSRPRGGEAELTYPVEFPARSTVRSWPEDKVAPQAARHRGELGQCHKGRGRPAALRLTVYIGPGGRVASAGLSADEPIDERLGSCLVARALTWRFEDPLGQLVKASYAVN